MDISKNIQKKKRGRPKASKQIDKTAILEIALQEFANKGFDGVRQKIIAEKAGIANSLMNYHFESKDDLWKQCVMQLGKRLEKRNAEVQAYFKDLHGIAALKAYTRQFIYFSAEHPEFYKVIFHEMCTQTDRADWLVETILRPLHDVFGGSQVSMASGKEEFRGIPSANISSIIIGASNVFFIHAFQMKKMYNTDPFEKDEIEKHADIVIDILFSKFES
ncbi:MAG: TetR family transcriptional regulator [Saprospiraceae bacterium]|nr:TetR family transcriptional regulator [Saprospiraceae bacterium]|tara:strand:- start:285 stop:941 length:657 start_codon:yes stop_codon:yes gene_type:complete